VAVGVYDDGKLRFAGKVGSGFTAATRKRLLAEMAPLVVETPPFDPPPPRDWRGRWGGDLNGITWIRPELVIRAELGGWTRDGHVRQTSFKGIEAGGSRPRSSRGRGLVGSCRGRAEAETPGACRRRRSGPRFPDA
jgi:bifunctional non-homologous end joining protein LigD